MSGVIEIVAPKERDIGGFDVRRVLPAATCRAVGPFVFLDDLGPVTLPPGEGLDVRPHPHIGIATVTYLFEGTFTHRDSLGSHLAIRPGAVNWMIAGRGVVHSERSDAETRRTGGPLRALQAWVALPREDEEMAPAFEHHPADTLPEVDVGPGVHVRVLAGTAFGATSPVGVRSPTLYAEVELAAGATLVVPTEHAERSVLTVDGEVQVEGRPLARGHLAVLAPGAEVPVRAVGAARVVLLGGAPLDGPRHLWWNLVSSRRERVVEAADAWRAGAFPTVPGDEAEHIPAPDGPPPGWSTR